MANLKEQNKWEDVYRIEENDPVVGGENGLTNKPIKNLTNRTLWLRKMLESLGKRAKPLDISATTTNTSTDAGHSHQIDQASTTQKGIVQLTSDTGLDSETLAVTAKAAKGLSQRISSVQTALGNYVLNSKKSDSVSSASSDTIATSKAVKTAHDKGVEGLNKANQVDAAALKNSGNQVLNGRLQINAVNGWSTAAFGGTEGAWRMEFHPTPTDSTDRRFNVVYRPDDGDNIYLRFPHFENDEKVAYQSWASDQLNNVIDSAPSSLNTLKKLATAIGNDANFSTNTSRKIEDNKTAAKNANDNANNRVAKSGDTMTGDLAIKNGNYSKLKLFNTDKEVRIESRPDSESGMLKVGYIGSSSEHSAVFPKSGNNKIVAYQDWTSEQLQNVVDNAPTRLNTLKKLASAIGNDANFSANTQQKIEDNKEAAKNANDNANNRVAKSGDTMTGDLQIKNGDISKVRLFNTAKEVRLESRPDSENAMLKVGYIGSSSEHSALFPKSGNNKVVAYQDWSDSRFLQNTGNQELNGRLQINAVNGWSAAAFGGTEGTWRMEFHPTPTDSADRRFNVIYKSNNSENVYLRFPHFDNNEKVAYQGWVSQQADALVRRAGDTMTGTLTIKGNVGGAHANGIRLINTGGGKGTASYLDFFSSQEKTALASLHFYDAGSFSVGATILTTPNGSNYNTDRRQEHTRFEPNGDMWVRNYGYLHDKFATNEALTELSVNTFRKSRFSHRYYDSHYQGAEVYDIPTADDAGLRIIIMSATVNGTAEVYLPESFSGFCIPTATDVGDGKKSLGVSMVGTNKVKIWNGGKTGVQIQVMGWANF